VALAPAARAARSLRSAAPAPLPVRRAVARPGLATTCAPSAAPPGSPAAAPTTRAPATTALRARGGPRPAGYRERAPRAAAPVSPVARSSLAPMAARGRRSVKPRCRAWSRRPATSAELAVARANRAAGPVTTEPAPPVLPAQAVTSAWACRGCARPAALPVRPAARLVTGPETPWPVLPPWHAPSPRPAISAPRAAVSANRAAAPTTRALATRASRAVGAMPARARPACARRAVAPASCAARPMPAASTAVHRHPRA